MLLEELIQLVHLRLRATPHRRKQSGASIQRPRWDAAAVREHNVGDDVPGALTEFEVIDLIPRHEPRREAAADLDPALLDIEALPPPPNEQRRRDREERG